MEGRYVGRATGSGKNPISDREYTRYDLSDLNTSHLNGNARRTHQTCQRTYDANVTSLLNNTPLPEFNITYSRTGRYTSPVQQHAVHKLLRTVQQLKADGLQAVCRTFRPPLRAGDPGERVVWNGMYTLYSCSLTSGSRQTHLHRTHPQSAKAPINEFSGHSGGIPLNSLQVHTRKNLQEFLLWMTLNPGVGLEP